MPKMHQEQSRKQRTEKISKTNHKPETNTKTRNQKKQRNRNQSQIKSYSTVKSISRFSCLLRRFSSSPRSCSRLMPFSLLHVTTFCRVEEKINGKMCILTILLQGRFSARRLQVLKPEIGPNYRFSNVSQCQCQMLVN